MFAIAYKSTFIQHLQNQQLTNGIMPPYEKPQITQKPRRDLKTQI